MLKNVYDNGGFIGTEKNIADESLYVLGVGTATESSFASASPYGDVITSGGTVPIPNADLLEEGDLVIFAAASDYGYADLFDSVGWTTVLSSTEGGSFGVYNSISYKVMGSVPDTTYSVRDPGYSFAYIFMVLKGVDPTNPIMESVNGSTTSSGMPVTSSLNGSYPAGTAVIQLGFLDDDNVAISVTGSDGYSVATATNSDTAGATMMAVYKILESSQTSIPSYTFQGSGSDAGYGHTLVLNVGGTAPIYGNKQNSGIWSLKSSLESIEPFVSTAFTDMGLPIYDLGYDEDSSNYLDTEEGPISIAFGTSGITASSEGEIFTVNSTGSTQMGDGLVGLYLEPGGVLNVVATGGDNYHQDPPQWKDSDTAWVEADLSSYYNQEGTVFVEMGKGLQTRVFWQPGSPEERQTPVLLGTSSYTLPRAVWSENDSFSNISGVRAGPTDPWAGAVSEFQTDLTIVAWQDGASNYKYLKVWNSLLPTSRGF